MLFQMQQYREASPERTQLLGILTHVLFGLEPTDEELVFKCSEKIYEEEPSLVLRCFIDEKGMICHLNIYHIVKHLQHLTEGEPSVYQRNKLALQYLSVVVPHVTPTASQLPADHNLVHLLAVMYIETIKDLKTHDEVDHALVDDLQQSLHSLLIEQSTYLPEELLKVLPEGDMMEERCVILSKMHEHEKALDILLYSLHSLEKAYQYCQDCCEREDPRDQGVYQVLVHV